MTEEEKKAAADKQAADAKAAEDAKGKGKPDSEKTADELKAEAEAIEAELKAAKGGATEDEIKANYIRRKEKAQEKLARIKEGGNADDDDDKPNTRKKPEIAVEDLVTLEVKGIEKDSEQAKILAKYVKAGIVSNYKEAFNHVAVKAELDALDATKNAKTVIDENDTSENGLKTKKEIVAGYKASGEVPADPKMQKAIADSNLEQMTQL